MADQQEPNAELIIPHPEERFAKRHTRVTKRLVRTGFIEIDEKLLVGNADSELNGKQLLMAERVAAARPGGAIRISEVIERIIARDNFEWPNSPPARMAAPPTLQRAGPSGLNAHLPPFRRRVNSSDEEEPEQLVWPPRIPHLKYDHSDYEH